MPSIATVFNPGALIKARGRDWVVQPDSQPDALRLRPFGGTEADIITLLPELELTPPSAATFPWPTADHLGNHDGARLLRDALKLKLRSGAGPFRSFGNIAVEPRTYQLVPLLMALRLPVVRLLIADDVGVGKTIEAGLIARELLDRGEIARLAVLCPPHLVDQWQRELSDHFHLKAAALTSSSAAKLERDLPHGVSLFEHYPIVVVSLDYIKNERHRDHFLSIAPECVIVDEAHTCTASGRSRQLRFQLLQKLSDDTSRHLILLTATPHSGDEVAFANLLGLLNRKFEKFAEIDARADHPLRVELARHFVQRRRKDIQEWQTSEAGVFPSRETGEAHYSLSGDWGAFFDEVQDYCHGLADREQHAGGGKARLIWYAALALLRCVASSPAAAEKALSTRLTGALAEVAESDDDLFDGRVDNLEVSDQAPSLELEESEKLRALIARAKSLVGKDNDPKLAELVKRVGQLVKDGYSPVVFCRYVPTAHYVAEHLRKHFPQLTIKSVTGEITPEERREAVAELAEADKALLVATDCLSEGINLQHAFDAVVHYDLAWNPTRHEQREGRVDRFGQQSPKVRALMLYGSNNPIDGFILRVILRKAESIRQELGVLVPLPEDETRINEALVKAALMKRREQKASQPTFDFSESGIAFEQLEIAWEDALKKAKANRTRFAQNSLRPEDVLPEWERQRLLIGGPEQVKAFVEGTCRRLNSPLEAGKKDTFKFIPAHLPVRLRERLADEEVTDDRHSPSPFLISFRYPAPPGARHIHRSHPLVAVLADYLLETAMSVATDGERPLAARAAVTATEAPEVTAATTLYLLRLRHRLTFTRRRKNAATEEHHLMAEETVALAVRGRAPAEWLPLDATVDRLLDAAPSSNLDAATQRREIDLALTRLTEDMPRLVAVAGERAETLRADHMRVREAAGESAGRYAVEPCLPVDVLGVYTLLPDSL